MQKNIVIWSVIGAIAVSTLCTEPSEARRRYSVRRTGYARFHARRSNRPTYQAQTRQQRYYKPASLLAQIDRSGSPAKSASRREAPVRQRRSSPQGDDRFPLRSEPNIAREPQSGVTEAKANSLRKYSGNQPHYAMQKLLGEPTRRTEDGTEIYNLKGTGSPFQASRRLVVRYRQNPDGSRVTSSWHQE